MRKTVALSGLLLLVMPNNAWASAACRWDTLVDVPPLRFWDSTLVLQRAYICPAEAAGSLLVHWQIGHGSGVQIKKADGRPVDIKPQGKWERSLRLQEKLWANTYCGQPPPQGAKGYVMGVGYQQKVVYDLPISARIVGSGDLAALSGQYAITARCRLCDGGGQSIAIKKGRAHASFIDAKTRIQAEVSQSAWACATGEASLSLRFFRNDNTKSSDIRPIFVMDHLQRHFQRQGDTFVMDVAAPSAQLCQKLGRGNHNLLWETVGKGELGRIGGGRSRITIKC